MNDKPSKDSAPAFEKFVLEYEPALRRAFVAAYGTERGREATAEALAWAWEHWQQTQTLHNPRGYLWRVGVSRTRPRKTPIVFPEPGDSEPWIEPALPAALAALTESQRTAVVLVHGHGWRLREVAELLGVKTTTVQNHLERGMTKLRLVLEVTSDAQQ